MPEVTAYAFCGAATVSVATGDNDYVWYTGESGGEPLEGTTALDNATYYVAQTANGCESQRAMVTVTINAIPDAPDVTGYTFCGGATVNGANGENDYLWYSEADGEPLEGSAALVSGPYFISQSVNGCESEKTEINVTINDIPDVPDAAANQDFSNGETLANLDVTGENLNWYADENGENALPDTTALQDNTTYYVSQTINGCEGPLFAITVSVLGINDINLTSFACYPNPTAGSIMLTNDTIMDSVDIYTLTGQKVNSSTINAAEYELDLSALAAGTYIITVQSGMAVKNTKVVKE